MNRAASILVVLLVAASAAAEEELPVPVQRYLDGRKLLYEDDLPSAVELFERVVKEHPESDVADDSLYWAAWCLLRMPEGRPRAVEAFLRLIRRYPESPWLDEAAAALPETAHEEAKSILAMRFRKGTTEDALERAQDGLAAIGDEEIVPALELRLTVGDEEAAVALSRLGAVGAAALEGMVRDANRGPTARATAFRGWTRAILVERSVTAERAQSVLKEIEKDPALVEIRREIRSLAAALAPREEEEDLREAVRRLRREVEGLRKQVEEIEKLVRSRVGD